MPCQKPGRLGPRHLRSERVAIWSSPNLPVAPWTSNGAPRGQGSGWSLKVFNAKQLGSRSWPARV